VGVATSSAVLVRAVRYTRRALINLVMAAAVMASFMTAAAGQAPGPASRAVSDPGYVASAPAATSWTVTGSITVPTLVCAPHGFSEIIPSLYAHSLLFDNNINVGEEVVLECNNGTASYVPFFLEKSIPDQPMPITFSPGDTLRMTMVDETTPSGLFTVTVRDGTQTASFSGGAFSLQSVRAEGVIQCLDAPGRCGPPWPAFPQFGSIAYRHVTVNDMTLQQLGATGTPGSNGRTARIRTSALDNTGAGFKMVWQHS
jgi:hypothetical protein